MSKTTNIFRPSEVDSFAVPHGVFNRLLTDPEVKVTTVIVYAYLLSKASSPTVRIYIGDALNDTGLSRPVFIEARVALVAMNLVKAEETSKQGVWNFEILSERGGKLPTYEDFVVFRDQPVEIITAYYCDRLGVRHPPEVLHNGNLRFACPFHVERAGKHSLTVTLDRNNGLHGRFICGKDRCGRRGGMIEFEQAHAVKQDRHLTKSQASQAVRSFIVSKTMHQNDHEDATKSTKIPTL